MVMAMVAIAVAIMALINDAESDGSSDGDGDKKITDQSQTLVCFNDIDDVEVLKQS